MPARCVPDELDADAVRGARKHHHEIPGRDFEENGAPEIRSGIDSAAQRVDERLERAAGVRPRTAAPRSRRGPEPRSRHWALSFKPPGFTGRSVELMTLSRTGIGAAQRRM